MEQQIQPDQISNPQMAQQQMMLCPVRLVYDTPIIMQQGERVQQNQAILLNTQNPPPWIRPVQNQVIYVQQVPNNFMPVQQHLDPNLYVQQQYVNYPQIMAQHMLNQKQHEQIRPVMHMPTVIPTHMMQNIQQSIQQHMQPNIRPTIQNRPDERTMVHAIPNYQPVQATSSISVPNTVHNQYNIVQSASNNRQIVNNVQVMPQNFKQNIVATQTAPQTLSQSTAPSINQNTQQTLNQNTAQTQTLNQNTSQTQTLNQNTQQSLNQNAPQILTQNTQHIINQNTPQILNQNQVATQKVVELQNQAVSANIRLPVSQYNAMARPQFPQMVNQMQHVITTNQNLQNLQQMSQMFAPNVRHSVPAQTQTVAINVQNVQAPLNAMQNIQRPMVPSTDVNKSAGGGTVAYTTIRNGQAYTYRAIQPRPQSHSPQQFKNVPNLLPMGAQSQQPMQRPNAPETNPINPNQTKSIADASTATSHIKSEPNTNLNRKRKSESPDEVQKKMAVNSTVYYGNIAVTAKPKGKNIAKNVKSSHSIGVNTVSGPGRKTEEKSISTQTTQTTQSRMLQITPMEVQENPMQFNKVAENTPMQYNKVIENNPMQLHKVIENNPMQLQKVENNPMQLHKVVENNSMQLNKVVENNSMQLHKVVENNPMQLHKAVENNSNQLHKVVENSPMQLQKVAENNPLPMQFNKVTDNTQQTERGLEIPRDSKEMLQGPLKQSDTEKLVRNTVYTQARGRLLSDKQNEQNVNTEQGKSSEVLILVKNNQGPTKRDENTQTMDMSLKSIKMEKPEVPNEGAMSTNAQSANDMKTDESCLKPVQNAMEVCEAAANLNEPTSKVNEPTFRINDPSMKTNESTVKVNEQTEKIDKSTVKIEPTVQPNESATKLNETKQEANIKSEEVQSDSKNKEVAMEEKKEYMDFSINDIKGGEIRIVDGSIVKQDKDYVLTHVLDGYVIQESNVPFAIRKPLQEKTIFTNTPVVHDQDQKNETIMSIIKENAAKDNITKENKQILDIFHLNLNEVKPKEAVQEKREDRTSENDNPFGHLKQSVVKTWTVDELASHLSKYNWNETISILREHEIDGESLLLVSKPQLLTIGVNETHADVICDFVRS